MKKNNFKIFCFYLVSNWVFHVKHYSFTVHYDYRVLFCIALPNYLLFFVCSTADLM